MASLRCPAASAGSPLGSPGSLSRGLSVSNLDQRLHNMGGSGFPRGRVQHARSPKGSPLDPTHITLATSYRSKQITRPPAKMRGAEGQQTQAPLLMSQTAASRCEGEWTRGGMIHWWGRADSELFTRSAPGGFRSTPPVFLPEPRLKDQQRPGTCCSRGGPQEPKAPNQEASAPDLVAHIPLATASDMAEAKIPNVGRAGRGRGCVETEQPSKLY